MKVAPREEVARVLGLLEKELSAEEMAVLREENRLLNELLALLQEPDITAAEIRRRWGK